MATVSWIGTGEFGQAYWDAASNWSSGSVPTSGDDVLIDTSVADFEIFVTAAAVAQSLTLDMAANGAVYNESTLTIGGPLTLQAGDIVNDGTLAPGGLVTVASGDLDNNSGVIVGGTIDQAGGSIYWGTLDGVTVLGTMGSAGNPVSPTIRNGLTVLNNGTAGTIYAYALEFSGNQTQDNATIVFSPSSTIESDSTLTLGPSLTLEAPSGSITFGNVGTTAASFVNQGTIEQAGGILATSFTNDGLMIFAGNPGTVELGNSFVNEGTADISAGQTVEFIPTSPAIFANQDGGTILAQGTSAYLLIASHGTAPYTNDGVIAVDQGATLQIGANLSGGTIASDGSGQIISGPYFVSAGTFAGPTVLQGTLDLAFGVMTFAEGFSLQGAALGASGVLELDGSGVAIRGSETLDSGTIDLSGGGNISAGDTLDLGASVLVNASGDAELETGALLLNEGTILATTAGSAITFDAGTGTFENTGSIVIGSSVEASVLGSFANTGSLTLQAGGTFDLNYVTLADLPSGIVNQGGVMQIGTLDGQGGTLDLTPDSPLNGAKIGTLENMTLITDGGSLDLGASTLDDVTLHGMLNFGTGEVLTLTGSFAAAGLDGTGQGTLAFPGSLASFDILGGGTLDNLVMSFGGDAPPGQAVLPDAITAEADAPGFNPWAAIQQFAAQLPANDWTLLYSLGTAFGPLANFLLGNGAYVAMSGEDTTNDGSIDPAADANLNIQITNFTNGGTIVSSSDDAFQITSATLTNTGTFDADGGLFGVQPALDGNGTVAIGDGGGFAALSSVAAGQTIAFEPGGGTLQLFQPTQVAAQITGFAPGDYIDLANINVDTIMASPGTLIAYDGGSIVAQLTVVGDYSTGDYVFGSDDNDGTVINVTCFLAGSRIETPDGPVPVETLRAGDLVLTVSGAPRPVRWIGERHLDASRHPRPAAICPIRVAPGAFAPDVPRRALLLSPDHAVFVEGVLIPVKYLLNGTTIRPARRRRLHYLHVELDSHDVVLAEGLPVETYLDVGDRGRFENAGVPVRLHPDFVARRWEAEGYAPLVVTGPKLAAVRAMLAGLAATDQPCQRAGRSLAHR